MNRFINKLKNEMLKKETNASTAKIAIWYVIGNFFAKGMAMISTPIFTRLMSKSEYGQFSNFTSWESIITILVTLDFSSSIARAKYDFDERMNEYISSILIFSNFVTLCAYFFVEFNQSFFETLFSMDILYIRMLFVYLLFMPAFSYLQLKHRIYKKYKFFVAFSISSAIIRTAVSVLLVLVLDDKLFGRICGYLIPITLFNIVLWVIVIVEGRKVSWSCIKYACKISVPLIPHGLSGIVLGSSDRIMITYYCGSVVTAVYSVAYSVSLMATLLWTSMNQAWTPWLYDNMNARNEKVILKNSKIYLGTFSILVIGVLLISPEIILVLGGEQYYAARYAMPPIILGCAFQFIYGMYVNIEIFAKRTVTISIGTMAAAALNLILNALFVPKYGYIAAAYTTMIGYFALLVFHYCIVKTRLKEYSGIYDERFIFLMMFLIIAFSGISLILYQHNITRYLLILMYAIIMIVGVYKCKEVIKRILAR